jgi:hypothetical protein
MRYWLATFNTFLINSYPVTTLVISYGSSQLLIPGGQLINNYLDAASPSDSHTKCDHVDESPSDHHEQAYTSLAGRFWARRIRPSESYGVVSKARPTDCQVYMVGPVILTHMRRAFIASKDDVSLAKCRL